MELVALASEYWPELLRGLATTLGLAVFATGVGAALALPLAIARAKAPWPVAAPIALLVSLLRGTPMLAQLFLVYYGSGQFRAELETLGLWQHFREPLFCALFTFTLNSMAYQTEILRGAIGGVDAGEIEAGRAIGMGRAQLYRRIVLPHAYRIALPALGNEFILMVKGSAIASVVTLLDLTGEARLIFSRTFDFGIYLHAALLYLAISFVFAQLWSHLERRLAPQYRMAATERRTAIVPGMRT